MYKVEVTKEAAKSLKKIPVEVKKDIKSKIIYLADNMDIIVHKKLKGNYFEDMYKLRIGNYRVIYSMDKSKKILIIEYAGHRKSIYK